jgi:hypothetical protein
LVGTDTIFTAYGFVFCPGLDGKLLEFDPLILGWMS